MVYCKQVLIVNMAHFYTSTTSVAMSYRSMDCFQTSSGVFQCDTLAPLPLITLLDSIAMPLQCHRWFYGSIVIGTIYLAVPTGACAYAKNIAVTQWYL